MLTRTIHEGLFDFIDTHNQPVLFCSSSRLRNKSLWVVFFGVFYVIFVSARGPEWNASLLSPVCGVTRAAAAPRHTTGTVRGAESDSSFVQRLSDFVS